MHTDESTAEFEQHRTRLFGLAYRMLGSAHEAEDAVQDAFLRWHGADRTTITTASGWLSTVVTNLCLNRLSAARARREQYVGPWLPEPVLTSNGTLGPLETAEQRESVSFAVLMLLERLTPPERAVFVLREAFAHSHREIAKLLELSEPHCRQLHRRARQRVDADAPRFDADHQQRFRLVERFLAAARDGDVQWLEQALAEDVASWTDGGGRVNAARHPILGRDRVIRYLVGGLRRFGADVELLVAEINGVPGAVASRNGVPAGAVVPKITRDRIVALHIVVNPDKLRFVDG